MNKFKKTDLIVATVLLVAGIGTAGVASAAAESTSFTEGAREYLAVYGSHQTAADRLPADFPVTLHGDGGIDPGTSRFLGETADGLTYWSVADVRGNLCLVVDDPIRVMTAAGCGSVSRLDKGSIALEHYEAKAGGVQAFLVADGYDDARVPSPWVRVGSNLLLVLSDDADGSPFTIEGRGGSVELLQFPKEPQN